MIVVRDMSERFALEIDSGEEKLTFIFRQLTYKEKNLIAGLTTRLENGNTVIDSSLTCFYVLKYGLVSVDGLYNSDGKPWKLKQENEVNTDESIDALLNCKVSNGLIWAANSMLSGIPDEIINPITGKKIEGVEIKPVESGTKKKS